MTTQSTGRVVYLHGLPGSVEEAIAALGTTSVPAGIQVLDRLGVVGKDADAAVLAAFDATGGEPCVLVGFSLGAMWALKLAALFQADAFPANMIIDLKTMKIVDVIAGVPEEGGAFWKAYEKLLAAN